jgi:hypothetical protein
MMMLLSGCFHWGGPSLDHSYLTRTVSTPEGYMKELVGSCRDSAGLRPERAAEAALSLTVWRPLLSKRELLCLWVEMVEP